MKQRTLNFNTIIVIIALAIIYLIPISTSTMAGKHFDVFSYTKLIFIPMALLIVFYYRNLSVSNFILSLFIIVKTVLYGGNSTSEIYLLSIFICLDYLIINKDTINKRKVERLFNFFIFFFLIQIVICSIRQGKIVSFIGDKNYLGYFIFLIYIYHSYNRKKSRWIWLLLGFLSLSRNYLVAVCFFWLFEWIIKIRVISIVTPNMIKIFWGISQFLIIPLSIIYCNVFENASYKYVYRVGLSRMIHFFDESNYLRFKVNELVWETINLERLLLGFKEGEFAGLTLHPGKRLYPHNTILLISVQMGILTVGIYIYQCFRLIKLFHGGKYLPFWMALGLYQLFLGPSSFYGIELIIIFAVLLLTEEM